MDNKGGRGGSDAGGGETGVGMEVGARLVRGTLGRSAMSMGGGGALSEGRRPHERTIGGIRDLPPSFAGGKEDDGGTLCVGDTIVEGEVGGE